MSHGSAGEYQADEQAGVTRDRKSTQKTAYEIQIRDWSVCSSDLRLPCLESWLSSSSTHLSNKLTLVRYTVLYEFISHDLFFFQATNKFTPKILVQSNMKVASAC